MRPGGAQRMLVKRNAPDRSQTSEFKQVSAQAHFTVVDAMDLALLTGQRPADVLKLKRSDIRDGALWVTQNKTGARLGIEIIGELAAVIARISARPRQTVGLLPSARRQRPAAQPVRTSLALRQGSRACEGQLSVSRHSGEGSNRHR